MRRILRLYGVHVHIVCCLLVFQLQIVCVTITVCLFVGCSATCCVHAVFQPLPSFLGLPPALEIMPSEQFLHSFNPFLQTQFLPRVIMVCAREELLQIIACEVRTGTVKL